MKVISRKAKLMDQVTIEVTIAEIMEFALAMGSRYTSQSRDEFHDCYGVALPDEVDLSDTYDALVNLLKEAGYQRH